MVEKIFLKIRIFDFEKIYQVFAKKGLLVENEGQKERGVVGSFG